MKQRIASKAAFCIFFAGSQRRFASAIEVTDYIYRHRWKYRSSLFRVNSGIVLFLDFSKISFKPYVLTWIYIDAFCLSLNMTQYISCISI